MDKPKIIKALISYKDWMLLERGEIKPKIGDKIIVFWERSLSKTEINEINELREVNKAYFEHNWTTNYNNIYVEIDYLPEAFKEGYLQAENCCKSIHEIDKQDHAIEFAKWMDRQQYVFHDDKWGALIRGEKDKTSEELYKEFLKWEKDSINSNLI